MKFTFRAKFNKNNNMNTLTKIKNLRKSHKYTQNFVAKHIETSGPNYSRYESGERNFTIEHIKKIASLYDVSISYLLDEEDDNYIITKEQFNKLIEAKKVIEEIELNNRRN